MGLDATVYCNCFQTKRMNVLPPKDWVIEVLNDGSLNCDNPFFIPWLDDEMCNHKYGVACEHYLGNITLISNLRNQVNKYQENIPIIWNEIIYSGTHCGSHMNVSRISDLHKEVIFLQKLSFQEQDKERMDNFLQQLLELIEASNKYNHPISF
ncbi:hypothetical protein [Candidatus Uabimicrobium sp. HlEnr_7]|uniref:hypothetical protein n=1 Tax=Candidatus Uabimicrobium helgolandensis TaxID=3095367 RepID=UPI003558196E